MCGKRDTVRCTLNRSIRRRSADPLGACIVLRSSGGREDSGGKRARAPGPGRLFRLPFSIPFVSFCF